MTDETAFDEEAGHRFFSAQAFNRAWDYIDNSARTSEETEAMLNAAHASFWHWSQRPDRTRQNLSVGYWQLARVYALAGIAGEALRYAQLCLETSLGEGPFYEGYAYEALARAESVAGDGERAAEYRARGLELAAQVADPEERAALEADLQPIKG
jgi:hypothetical protein